MLKSKVYSSSYGQNSEGEISAKTEHEFTIIKTLSNLDKNSIKHKSLTEKCSSTKEVVNHSLNSSLSSQSNSLSFSLSQTLTLWRNWCNSLSLFSYTYMHTYPLSHWLEMIRLNLWYFIAKYPFWSLMNHSFIYLIPQLMFATNKPLLALQPSPLYTSY